MPSQAMIDDAKTFLKTEPATGGGGSIYDHLCKVLHSVLENRSPNPVDTFEDISKSVRAAEPVDRELGDEEVRVAQTQAQLFERSEEVEPERDDDDVDMPLPDLMEIAHHFEYAGIGLGRVETFRINLALKILVSTHNLQDVRFWGKIMGTKKSYIVAEVEFKDGEEEEQEEEEPEANQQDEEEEEEKEEEEDALPKPDWKQPPKVPKEESTGCNKRVYFVCNEPGSEWVKLPPVDPAEISCARKIKKFFTGDLNAPVVSYPPFPGTEINYLRAQIARISAGTHICPIDYRKFEDGDEDDSMAEGRDECVLNPEYEPLSIEEMIDPELRNWVHHVLHILPQGRCKWVNPAVKGEAEDFEDEEEEEEEEGLDEIQEEEGPPLLNPISQDAYVDGFPAWSACRSSDLVPQYSIAFLRSNAWPGAYVYGIDKKVENVYIGWGQKYSSENYSPVPPPPVMQEYFADLETTEIPDPTVEEEKALEAMQQEQLEREAEEAEMEDDEDDED